MARRQDDENDEPEAFEEPGSRDSFDNPDEWDGGFANDEGTDLDRLPRDERADEDLFADEDEEDEEIPDDED